MQFRIKQVLVILKIICFSIDIVASSTYMYLCYDYVLYLSISSENVKTFLTYTVLTFSNVLVFLISYRLPHLFKTEFASPK